MKAIQLMLLAFVVVVPAAAQIVQTDPNLRILEVVTYTVTDESNQPISGAMVEALQFSGSKFVSAITNSEGRVKIGFPAGTFTIRVTGANIEERRVEERIDGLNATQQFIADRPATIVVRLKNPGAKPPAGFTTAASLQIPAKARGEYEKGMAAAQAKKYEEAKKYFSRATAIYPKYAEAFNGIGLAELRMNQVAAAKQDFQRAVDADPEHPTAYVQLGKLALTQEQDAAAAEPLLERAQKITPQDPELLSSLCFAKFALSKFDEAIAIAKTIHSRQHQGYPLAHFVAGAAYEAKSEIVEARQQYQTYLEEAPKGPHADRVKAALEALPK
jgi:tetratricopeptide (TPR) repeat protein